MLKVGKLEWIEYIDKGVFTELTYFGFHLEHDVNKYIQNFFQSFLACALSLLAEVKRT